MTNPSAQIMLQEFSDKKIFHEFTHGEIIKELNLGGKFQLHYSRGSLRKSTQRKRVKHSNIYMGNIWGSPKKV